MTTAIHSAVGSSDILCGTYEAGAKNPFVFAKLPAGLP